ncbi:MAG TPA: VOC family protein [Terriglobales bacterium]|jgi:PhnB protein
MKTARTQTGDTREYFQILSVLSGLDEGEFMAVKPVPDGYHNVTPYLVIKGAAKAIDFYKTVFGATEVMRMDAPGGRIGHAELKIGDSHVMLADEYPEMKCRSPQAYGGSPVSMLVYVPDVDATVAVAQRNGAKLDREVQDQFYGDRMGQIVDPFGHIWSVATHKEDVSPEEMKKRMAALQQK